MRKPYLYIILCWSFGLSYLSCSAQANLLKHYEGPPFQSADTEWVDSVFNSMSTQERIGQLFMVAAYSNKGEDHMKELETMVTEHHVGGLIFFKGTPLKQLAMTEILQARAKVPLMLGMDAEWGLAMRLDSTIHFPYQMTMGAIKNDTIIYEMGREVGRQLKRMGVHVNFAPVVDVNNNPANPVINFRSFGEDPYNVARKGTAYMKGLQREGILANAKHFPGHGDTDTDSHLNLPVVEHGLDRLDSLELFPFRQLINRGLGSMMVAHLYIPSLDSTPNLASTLSPRVVQDLLKDKMRFKGLVFTDALNMKGVAKFWEPGEVDLKALMAGNDVLLFPEDVPKAIEMIEQAIADGIISERDVASKCHKILMAKQWMGIGEDMHFEPIDLYKDLNNGHATRLNELLYERSLTVLRNDSNLLPLVPQQTKKLAYLSIGDYLNNPFHERLKGFGVQKALRVKSTPSHDRREQVAESLKDFGVIIIGLDGLRLSPKGNFGFTEEAKLLIERLALEHEVILSVFGNPYCLESLPNLSNISSIVIGYENVDVVQKKLAELLFGQIEASGRLPVSIGEYFPVGSGVDLRVQRLKSVIPEEIGISSDDLMKIDSIAQDGIDKGAYPSCVILVAKDGKVFYEKAFGYHTYEGKRPTTKDDLYDLASITKIAATAPSLIRLVDEGLIDIEGTLGEHLSTIPDTSIYHELILRDILTHQAGLVPWIPFYNSTLKNGQLDPELYQTKKKGQYNVEVAENVFMHHNQQDTILLRILTTPLRKKRDYKYSDLGYYFMKAIIEEKTGMPLQDYVDQEFYGPLSLETMGYLPLDRFSQDRIVPTEYDMYYRMQLLHGHVHDMGAAMQGGVGGHAGLFSNARDLASMMQMYLNGGIYSGIRVLNDSIIKKFTECQFCTGERDENRRAIAFDKPNRHGDEGPTCDCVSFESFGHSGFTGALAWADPEEDLVYIFLSNRIYPSMANKKLIKMSIRTLIMESIYEAVYNAESSAKTESKDLGLMALPIGQ